MIYVSYFVLEMSLTKVKIESRNVVNLPPDKNIPKGKLSSQINRKWVCLWCVIGASVVFVDLPPVSGHATLMFS